MSRSMSACVGLGGVCRRGGTDVISARPRLRGVRCASSRSGLFPGVEARSYRSTIGGFLRTGAVSSVARNGVSVSCSLGSVKQFGEAG